MDCRRSPKGLGYGRFGDRATVPTALRVWCLWGLATIRAVNFCREFKIERSGDAKRMRARECGVFWSCERVAARAGGLTMQQHREMP